MHKSIKILLGIFTVISFSSCKNDYNNLPDVGITLDTFDLDHNGLFDTRELTLVCNATSSGPTLITSQQLTKADKNKDGYITIDELEVLFYATPPGWIPCKK